ncbi:MAG: hypothetical protein HFG82_05880 [Dorea sp.]|nr:hypothetical protein [Dorea sp.]
MFLECYNRNIITNRGTSFMRKRTFLISCIFALGLLTGCSDNKIDEYVGGQITSIKENGSDNFAALLDEGIAESNELYVLQFPEELREPYLEFMKDSFSTISFEVGKAKKMNDGTFSVQVTYTPLNLKNTVEAANLEQIASLETTELTEAVTTILEKDSKLVKASPSFEEETITTLSVYSEGESYKISTDSLKNLLSQALYGAMAPYDQVCDILDCYDFVKAYLDASFKGEVARFALHTGRSEEEALAWYEEDVFDPPSDLSESYVSRYQEALKSMMKQCQYTVGIPKKENGIYSYTIEIKTTPNTSLSSAYTEFEGGTYYSIDEVSSGLVTAMEKYATEPTFGDETSMTISFNTSSMLSAGDENSELATLATTIFAIP